MHRFWGLTFGIVLLGCFVLTAVSPAMNWWLPMSASTYAPEIDRLFYLILGVVAFFYVLTEVILVLNIFRSAAPDSKAQFTHGNNRLEIIWSVIPGVILILLAVIQVRAWAEIKYPSHLANEVEKGESVLQTVIDARQWEYRIRYASPARVNEWSDSSKAWSDFTKRLPERIDDVHTVNDLHVWKGQKVVVFLKTRDVGHSIFFPNLRLKQDALPGKTIPVWFIATESNTKRMPDGVWVDGYKESGEKDDNFRFDMVCTQYCGSRHSLMRGKLFVHPNKDDYLAWLKKAEELHNGHKNANPAAVASR